MSDEITPAKGQYKKELKECLVSAFQGAAITPALAACVFSPWIGTFLALKYGADLNTWLSFAGGVIPQLMLLEKSSELSRKVGDRLEKALSVEGLKQRLPTAFAGAALTTTAAIMLVNDVWNSSLEDDLNKNFKNREKEAQIAMAEKPQHLELQTFEFSN